MNRPRSPRSSQHTTRRALRRILLSSATCLLVGLWAQLFAAGCSAPAQVSFEVKGKAPTIDGNFTNKHDWSISPSEVKIVMGDLHLMRQTLDQNLKVLSSIPPLVPAGTEVPADEIGKFGRFPGMWAINIIHNNPNPHSFPTGAVEINQWNQLQLRMSPAVTGVRGITAGDALLQNTVLFAGSIRKQQAVCNIRVRAALDLGIATRTNFTTVSTLFHRNTIEIEYARWFDDVNFGTLCDANTTATIEIDNGSQPQIIEQIKTAIPSSLNFQFSAGTAN